MEKGAKRHKIVTSDGNYIDTIFFNRRGRNSKNGETLVISCDGNAGFYEIGVLGTPVEAGYSVLGYAFLKVVILILYRIFLIRS